ncbi:MAG: ABC transporter substrate-binding protein [Paenibacillaceae bacterium]|nr:ABC transporter substrate-binding protein [Paenibacillaceae bacterium]
MERHTWSKKTLKAGLLLSLASLIAATGCSSTKDNAGDKSSPSAAASASKSPAAETNKPQADLPRVDLTWYYGINAAQADQQTVENAVNDYLAKNTKLNVTLHLKPIPFAEYDNKMGPIIASREKFDIMWTTGSWLNLYQPLIDKGGLLPLDDLLEKHAPKTRHSIMPEAYWDSIRSSSGDHKIYAIFSLQIAAAQKGFAFQKRFVDKYKFDVNKVKTVADLEPFLKQIKDNEPDIIPFAFPSTIGNGPFFPDNIRNIGSSFYYKQDPYKLIEREQTPEYAAYLDLMHDWYKKGYIYQDIAATQDFVKLQAKGNIAVTAEQGLFPGSDITISGRSNNQPIITLPMTPPVFSGASGTMEGISSTSPNPERAMMLLELVNTDVKLYQLLCYGVEGKHYKVVDGNYTPIDGAGYAPDINWVFGNTFNALPKAGQPRDLVEQTKKMNADAEVSPIIAFRPDDSALQTEVAAVRAVQKEYMPGLETGTYNPKDYLPKLLDNEKKAGLDKLHQAHQEQLDKWAAANGKKK